MAKREAWIREKHMLVFGLRSDLHRETDVDVFVSDPLGFTEAYAVSFIFRLNRGSWRLFVPTRTW